MKRIGNSENTYEERLDPGHRIRQGVQELYDFATHPLTKWLDLPEDLILKARSLPDLYQDITDIRPIAVVLAPLGWCVYSRSDVYVYKEAADQASLGNADKANTILTEHWNSSERLQISKLRLNPLYMHEEPLRLDIAEARFDLLSLAYDYHMNEQYEASIPIILAQIDGICADVTHKPADQLFQKKFFQQRTNHLVDSSTLEGHELGLATLSSVFSESVTETTLGKDLHRHGIMHGRTSKYGTLVNSTKAFVALEAFLMWANTHIWQE